MAIRVLVVDDAASFRALLGFLLPEDGDIEVVGEAASADEGIRLAAELRPDVVLTDVHLGGRTGLEAVEDYRAAAPGARVVVLSGSMPSSHRADAVLAKDTDPVLLREAIRGRGPSL